MTLVARTRPVSSSTRPVAAPTPSPARADPTPSPGAVPAPPRLLRPRIVCERTGLSRTTLWRLERRGDFPRHRQLSTHAVGWLEEEVTAWICTRTRR